jgi:hypothetical protein
MKSKKYTLHSLETYSQVMMLRKKYGWGCKKIMKYFNEKSIEISKDAIAGWIYKNKKP